jgi:hypothetical protein
MTFGEMRDMGVRGVVVYADYRCNHSVAISAGAFRHASRGCHANGDPFLGLRQRLGLGFGLGIADGLSQHLA